MSAASVLVSRPDSSFTIEQTNGGLDVMQALVGGGYLEALTPASDCSVYINEDGKQLNLPMNAASTLFLETLVPGFMRADHLVGPVVWLGHDDSGNERDLPFKYATAFSVATLANSNPDSLVVVTWKNDVWVWDTPADGPMAVVRRLITEARRAAEHGTIEVFYNVDRNRWVETRVDLMDHVKITLHDERKDRSYG